MENIQNQNVSSTDTTPTSTFNALTSNTQPTLTTAGSVTNDRGLKRHKRPNKSLADGKQKQKKRPRKNGKSDLGEDVASNSQSLSMFDEDSVEEGNDNESDLQEHGTVGIVNEDGDSELEDIQEVSDTDQE